MEVTVTTLVATAETKSTAPLPGTIACATPRSGADLQAEASRIATATPARQRPA
jgi:hypothetical protein